MSSNEPFDAVAGAALEFGTQAGPQPAGGLPPTRLPASREYMTFNETALWLRCSARTLQRLLETGVGPPVIRISERRLIFREADVRNWLEGRTIGRTETAPKCRRGRPPKAIAGGAS
jgi:hypothetical protein